MTSISTLEEVLLARCLTDQFITVPGVKQSSWYRAEGWFALSSTIWFPSNAGTPKKLLLQNSIIPSDAVVSQPGTSFSFLSPQELFGIGVPESSKLSFNMDSKQ